MTDQVETTPAETTALDYGNDFAPDAVALEVELSPEELEKVGLAPKQEEAADKPKEAGKEADPKAEAAKEEEKPRDAKGQFIPKARFDEVNNKAKAKVAALEAKIKAMSDRLAPLDGVAPDVRALETALDAKGDEYGKLLADGELEKANGVLKEINKINRQLGAIEASALASTHATESTHVDTLGQLVDMYKENYPAFDEDNKELYDQEIVNFVADLQGRFEYTGSSPAEALRMAVELTVAKFKLDPEPAAPASKDDARKAVSVSKAAKAANAQPPKLDSLGVDNDKLGLGKINLSTLTPEQFDKLPESTLARLRGDMI